MGGLTPVLILSQGFPSDIQKTPVVSSTFLNGQSGPTYRPVAANHLPYSEQWNFTIDHQITNNFYISAAYFANKGAHLLSNVTPINTLNPNYLSMGQQLYDEFQPGQTVLDGVRQPYAGWAEQMQACAPTVAQALLPFPQYCGSLPV
jgi:hypothetical protein